MDPRFAADTRVRVDDLRRDVRELREELRAGLAGLHDEARRGSDALARLERRDGNLRELIAQDLALQPAEAEIDGLLGAAKLREHLDAVLGRSTLVEEPFPHIVVDDLLTRRLYAALARGLPPAGLFEEESPDRRFMHLPFRLASRYGRRVWDGFVQQVVHEVLLPAVVETFHAPLEAWIDERFPAFGPDPLARLSMKSSGGRVFMHTGGYEIPPHRDPAWSFLTCLFYIARPDDDEAWGTQLYAVDDDGPAPSIAPHWIDKARCRLVRDVEYRPNRLLVFLNSRGAHGAGIPAANATPEVARALYQFRIMPDQASVAALIESLPAADREAWAGKMPGY